MKTFRVPIRIINALLISVFLMLTPALGLFVPTPAHALDDQNYLNTIGNKPTWTPTNNSYDPWGFGARNCTSYVAYMLRGHGVNLHGNLFINAWGSEPTGQNHWGNAYEWEAYAVSLGYVVDGVPAVGSVAQWRTGESTQGFTGLPASQGGVGHVAYVTNVNTDGSVVISDYNALGTGQFRSGITVRAGRYIHLERMLPGGWWQGPTPGPSSVQPGATIPLSAHIEANADNPGGLQKGDITVYAHKPSGSSWQLLKSIPFSGQATGDITASYPVPNDGTDYIRVSFNVFAFAYAPNSSPTAHQYAPAGIRQYCLSNCPVVQPAEQYVGWDSQGGGGGSSSGGGTSGGQSGSACVPGQYQAAVFQDPNYGGPCVIKGIGTYSDPTAIGLPNDSISSVKVGSGSLVTLCDNSGINSPCEWFTADDPDLSNNSLNTDTVSSMKVEGGQATTNCVPGDTQVAFFTGQNFQGSCTVRDVGRYDNAGALGLPDNSILSAKLGARANVRICQNDGNTSPCDQFESDKANFNATLVEGQVVSSAEVTLKGGIALCSGTNGGGDCKWFGADASHETLKNLSDVGFDNRTQSVVYDPAWDGRYHIVLYVDQNQTGALYHAEHSVGDLLAPYDNNISSIKIYKIGLPGASADSPVAGAKLPASTTSVNLNFGGGSERHVQVWSDGGYYFDSSWTTATSLNLTGLVPGSYHWQVQARDIVGEGAWTPVSGFTINTSPRVQSGSLTAQAGTATSIQVNATDDEGDPLTLTASGLPAFVTFTDNGSGIGTLNVAPGASVSGNYTITVTANDGDQTGTGIISLTVNQPQPVGYAAQYYNNQTLSGTPVFTRDEATINNDWGNGSPDASVPVDHFSARWTKTSDFTAGDYTFTVTADDGVRLYLDGTLVIDKWIDQGPTTYNITKTWAAGSHTVKVEYYENGGGAVAKFSYVQAPAGSQTITSQIAASSDDGEENASTSMSLTSSDLELTCDSVANPCPSNDPGKQSDGMRFGSLAIPKGATINSAYIVFTGKEAQSETTNLTFFGQAIDNAPTFTTTSGNISSRAKTTASVSWSNLPAWSVGPTYQTPDLSPIVQEIVNRSGWASGNAAAVIVTGLGHRTAWSYDGNSSSAAKLVVNFTPASTQTPPPAVIANGLYKLVNVGSGKSLDVAGSGTTDGTNVQIWTSTTGNNQKWQASQNTDGTYKLIDSNSNKVLDVNGSGTTDGTNVQVWTDNGSGAQKWNIVQNSDGTYKLVNPNSGKVLDVSGGGTADGTNVQIWTDNGSAAQKWQISAVTTTPPPAAPTFTGSGTVSGTSFVAGNTVTMNASYTSTSSANTTTRIHFEVHNPSDAQVFTKDFDNEAFTPGQTKTYTATWTIPAGAATGSYTVKGGAVSADWVTWYLWLNNMGQFTVNTSSSTGTELLTAAWHLTGNNGASELYQSIASNALVGKTTVRVTYNLHGITALNGDASALIFDQNGWKYVSLSNYGQNGLNGTQTVDIPISAFGLDLSQPVGTLHTRFWYGSAFTVDITSVQVL